MLARRLGVPIALLVLAAGASGCGSSTHESSTPLTVFSLSADPGQNIPVTLPAHRVVLTAVQLKTTLDSLLSDHVRLTAALMHEVAVAHTGTGRAVRALAANTQSLTNAIALVYGTDAGRAFAQLWEQHTQFFVDYAQGAHEHDKNAEKVATNRLRDYQNDFGSFVSTATGGGVGLGAVTALLGGHVLDLTRYIDADVDGHSADASSILVQAVAHIRVIAGAMGNAIVAQHLMTVTP